MEYTGLTSHSKCIRCGKEIAVTRQIITDEGFEHQTENAEARYIDRWGYPRNFCKKCMEG